jgi:hypothetical protein
VFAIGPTLISRHYRPRFDDAAVLLAVDRGGRECLPAASPNRRRSIHPLDRRIFAQSPREQDQASGMPDHSPSDFPHSALRRKIRSIQKYRG